MTRGVLYITWKGERDPSEALDRSIASLKQWHPELPHRVIEMPAGSNLLCKSQMYDLSPFSETLFLDADTQVMGDLDYGFSKAQQFGIACCINLNPWQRRYHNLIHLSPDAVEYSSGVVFFDKDYPRTGGVFGQWNCNSGSLDSECLYLGTTGETLSQPHNDQALFTLAMEQTGFNPFVLPLNWNLYPKWQPQFWGPIKILHGYDPAPPQLVAWNERQSQPDAVIQPASLA